MRPFDPKTYGAALEAILSLPAPDGLTHGPAVKAAEPMLAGLSDETMFGRSNRAMSSAGLAGLWLRFDFAERGHSMAQDLHGQTGDYWHAIHHRREPDYGNAKYWFRRVGAHPIHDDLLAAARAEDNGSAAAAAVAGWPLWDAFGFVDLCARHAGSGSPDEAFCKTVQQREWELLFDFCYRQDTGRS